MRPRLIQTLADLEQFIAQARAMGMKPSDLVLISPDGDEGELYNTLGLVAPTAIFTNEGPACPPFITFEYWTAAELYANSIHNDDLGTTDHWTWPTGA